MQYKVPQNVQREDTIIGPVTLKQLGILAIGGMIAYFTYLGLAKTYYWQVWFPPVGIITALTLAFAFLKIHSLRFHQFLMNFIEFHLLPKQRIWIQGTATPFILPEEKKEEKEEPKKEQVNQKKPKSLEELTNILDTHGKSELSKDEKKEGLNEMINKNYK